MRKERKSKDLLLDAILLRALEEENKGLEREIRAANEALTKEEDERLKALLKATWKKEQARQRRNRYLLRTAACFAVLLVVSFSAIMNVQAWRANVINFVLTLWDDHGVLAPQDPLPVLSHVRYYPTYIPERYTTIDVVLDNENTLLINYYGDDFSPSMTFQLLYGGTNMLIDTENAEIKRINYEDQELTILSKDQERQLLGIVPETEYHYMIVGELTEEEILKISSSVQAEKEE